KETKGYSFIYSFDLLASNENEQRETVKKLYTFLTESPSLINSPMEDFINAFSGKEVDNKIQWIAKSTRNKKTSKTSLLYLINELINNQYLSRSIINDIYK